MRTALATALLMALAGAGHAGSEPPTRAPHTEAAPKADLDRPATGSRPVDGKALCTYVDRDQNAPSQRGDCVADRDPAPQRPVEKSPPHPPGDESTPSAR